MSGTSESRFSYDLEYITVVMLTTPNLTPFHIEIVTTEKRTRPVVFSLQQYLDNFCIPILPQDIASLNLPNPQSFILATNCPSDNQ